MGASVIGVGSVKDMRGVGWLCVEGWAGGISKGWVEGLLWKRIDEQRRRGR